MLPALLVLAAGVLTAQPGMRNANVDTSWKKIYRATSTKTFDLVHTKLDVSFDYAKRRMPGKAWLTLKPHAYAQDSLVLDAKGMQVNKISVVQGSVFKPLAFAYPDTLQLHIALDKTYKPGETFTVFIDYVAKPDEMTFKGSAAIRDAKGLYFINPDGKDTSKPIQIWTQGETEGNSVWMPTIDKPNQKSTEEIYMTVPAKYVTLSNGLLKSSVVNKNGTRTDYWKMDLPHSTYLFFMGVGDFAVVKDKYKNIAVDYYVEPKYAAVARKIFGLTPEMIGFYGKILGVEFPWAKYAQMVGRDYVSGAMENTTATLHGSGAYRSSRELADANPWEVVVAHELFHQWFGDLVTAESWSNITVNESFADYSELLWQQYKYGKDFGDAENYNKSQGYLANRMSADRNLVRFHYSDKEDVFDGVSYTKGGRILHMLHTYLGDSAFFKGLNLYLTTNKFKNGEAQQLRLALEEVSGKDLNWFFNEWYYGSGHPVATISYNWSDSAKKEKVTIVQHQAGQLFTFPLNMEVYASSQIMKEIVWVSNTDSVSTFYLNTGGSQPSFVNVDVEKNMLWRKDDQKPKDWWVAQYDHANGYVDKVEVLNWLANNYDSSDAQKAIYAKALSDNYHGIRSSAIAFYNRNLNLVTPAEEAVLYNMAQKYYNQPTRAIAIILLNKKYGNKYAALYKSAVYDSSYTVAGAALEAIASNDMAAAKTLQPQLGKDAKGRLLSSLNIITYSEKTAADADSIVATFKRTNFFEKTNLLKPIVYYLANINDVAAFKKVAGTAMEISNTRMGPMMGGANNPLRGLVNENFNWLLQKKEAALAANPDNKDLQEQIKYVKDKMAAMQ